MEIMNCKMNLTFTNAAAATRAKDIAEAAIMNQDRQFWFRNAKENTAARLTVVDNTLKTEGDFLSDEMLEVSISVMKELAKTLSAENFIIDIAATDTYAEGWIEGNYTDGTMRIETTYYPEGYCEYVSCPECGEDVVRLDEYEPGKKYICPDCGEEIDLSKMYADCAPVIKTEIIRIV